MDVNPLKAARPPLARSKGIQALLLDDQPEFAPSILLCWVLVAKGLIIRVRVLASGQLSESAGHDGDDEAAGGVDYIMK